jgi:cytosine/adenosine deaminase-related metal-dependent hydrolase
MPLDPKPILIKGATLLSIDESIGDFAKGDVLIEGARIAAIGERIAAPADADLFDAHGKIVAPGLVNCHMHTWQTAMRGLTSNWTLTEYNHGMHRGLATAFTPDDIYIATLVGALGQMNAGATTLGDWCHNNPTPAHTDAAVSALHESGIRAVFLHGSPKPNPKPGQPDFSEIPHSREEIDRLAKTSLGDDESLVTLAMAILGPHYATLDVSRADFKLARDHNLVVSMHCGGGAPRSPGGWETLEAEGFIGSRTNIVHANNMTDDLIRRFVDRGVTFTIAPENEMTQGHGWPITGRVLRAGGQPSFGVDIESLVSTDMFVVARMALACERVLINTQSLASGHGIPDHCTPTTRDALRWITLEGARALGLDARLGSLTPGKQADLTIFDATALNMCPVHDPYSTVIMQSGISNVSDVMIAGQWKKRDGRLLWGELAPLLARLTDSGRRIVATARDA